VGETWVGAFHPNAAESIGDWTRYTYDTQDGDGPICITGTELAVFHRMRDPKKLMVILDGGGACWQGFYSCSITSDAGPPTGGSFADSDSGIDDPLADWSKVFMSYCDGSVSSGDNTVEDPIAAFAPSVYRFVFPPSAQLYVLNDSGPALTNPALVSQVNARVNDWGYTQVYPASCTECDPSNQPAAFVKWTLANDPGYKGALYGSDGDGAIRFFPSIPTAAAYRSLLLGR